MHAGVGTLCRVNLNESQETWQQNNSSPFHSWKEPSKAEWPHRVAQATGCMILRSCGPRKDVPLGVGFPPLLFHFSFSFTFAAWALHSVLVRVLLQPLSLDWQSSCWSRADNLSEPSPLHLVNGYSNLSTFRMGTFQSSVTFIIHLLT